MVDESEYDEYDDDGFDEAFADLVNGLKEAETREHLPRTFDLMTVNQSPQNGVSSLGVTEVVDNEYKLPHDAVSELSERIDQTSLSPFDRFRKQKGVLSVCLFFEGRLI